MTPTDEPDEGYADRLESSIAIGLSFLHEVIRDPDQTHRDVVMLSNTERIILIGGLVSIIGAFLSAISIEQSNEKGEPVSVSEVLSEVGVRLLSKGTLS